MPKKTKDKEVISLVSEEAKRRGLPTKTVKKCPMPGCLYEIGGEDAIGPYEKYSFCPYHGHKLVWVEIPLEVIPWTRVYNLPYNSCMNVMCPCGFVFNFTFRPPYCPNCGHRIFFVPHQEGPEDIPNLLNAPQASPKKIERRRKKT